MGHTWLTPQLSKGTRGYLPSSVIIGISLPDMMLLVTFTGVPIGSKPGGTRPESRNKEHAKNMRRLLINLNSVQMR